MYFFLGSVLPPLKIEEDLEYGFEDLLTLFKDNLSKKDFLQIKKIQAFIDLKNVENLLRKERFDSRGNLNEKELNEALLTESDLPRYLFEFLESHESKHDQITFFSKIYVIFFKEMEEKEKGFLLDYFRFERTYRLLMVGFRCKQLKQDITKQLQFEDFRDPIVAYLIAQKESAHFEFPLEYQKLDQQLKKVKKSPLDQYELLMKYRFNYLQEKIQDFPFSIDYVLGYFLQFMLIQDWHLLNEQKGHKHLNEIVRD